MHLPRTEDLQRRKEESYSKLVRSLHEAKAIESAIRRNRLIDHLIASRLHDIVTTSLVSKPYPLGAHFVQIETQYLKRIEYGFVLQQALNAYSDWRMCQELLSRQIQPYKGIYHDIVRAVSKGMLSIYDTTNMWNTALRLHELNYVDDLWLALVHLLRKRLLLVHLASTLLAHFTKVSVGQTKPGAGAVILARSKEREKFLVDHLRRRDDVLRGLLGTVSLKLCEGYGMRSDQMKSSRQSVATGKLGVAVASVFRRITSVSFARWKGFVAFGRAEETSASFLKMYGACRFCYALDAMGARLLSSALRRLSNTTKLMRRVEIFAAIVELQRIWRGATVRHKRSRRIRGVIRISYLVCRRAVMAAWIGWTTFLEMKMSIPHSKVTVDPVYRSSSVESHKQRERAAVLIQRYARGYVCRKVYRKLKRRAVSKIAALMIQKCLRRFNALRLVAKLRGRRIRYLASVKIQSLVRGGLVRIHERHHLAFRRRALMKASAIMIQKSWRRFMAQRLVSKLKGKRIRYFSSVKIQSLGRGGLVRIRKRQRVASRARLYAAIALRQLQEEAARASLMSSYEHQKQRERAAVLIQRYARGYVCRKVYRKLKRRAVSKIAALMIQKCLRRFNALRLVAKLRGRRIRYLASVKIQSLVRGGLVRIRLFAAKMRISEKEKLRAVRSAAIVCIQRFTRGYAVRRYLMFERTRRSILEKSRAVEDTFTLGVDKEMPTVAARYFFIKSRYLEFQNSLYSDHAIKIQSAFRRCVCVSKVKRLRSLNNAAALIQRTFRRHLVCSRSRERALLLQSRRQRAATTIQRIFRGFFVRRRSLPYIYSHRLLLFLRKLKVQIKCEKTLRIFRRRIARGQERDRLALESLERNLEEAGHEAWLKQLLVVRLQSQVRLSVARSNTNEKRRDLQRKLILGEKQRLDGLVTRFQALVRGVQSRRRFARQISARKKAREKARQCVECEINKASRRCVQCKDNFCERCFTIMHQKGTRKRHNWKSLSNAQTDCMASGSKSVSKAEQGRLLSQTGTESGGIDDESESNKQLSFADWKQFYDTNAKAKYWYNDKTGEASWVSPF